MSYTTNLPVNGTFNITATFGQTGSYWKNGHKGIDITSQNRTLYSICDGKVTVVSFDKNGWGNYVSVMPTGFERIRFILCHMADNSVKVKKGDSVSRLTTLGTMGSTGNSSGVHCHVEMRIDNTPVDVSRYLLVKNAKATGLKAQNYKFESDCQNAALEELLKSFDGAAASTDIKALCEEQTCEQREKELLDEINSLSASLKAANDKINKALEILK